MQQVGFAWYLLCVLRRWRLILLVTGLGVAVATGVSFILPDVYEATTTIIPPQDDGGMWTLGQKLGGGSGIPLSVLGIKSDVDIYTGMLSSRTAADALVRNFNLVKVYQAKSPAAARKILRDNTRISKSKENFIVVSVRDTDPERAAALANGYVAELIRLNRRLNTTAAERQKRFLAQRLAEVRADLEEAEERLKAFQQEHKLVALSEQAKALVEASARLKAEIMATETELAVLRQFATEDSLKVMNLTSRLQELRRQLAEIENGEGLRLHDGDGKLAVADGGAVFTPFTELPDLGLQLARLTRETKLQETLFELLTKQYELAKISAAKDTTSIQVLDEAVPPETSVAPRRKLIVAVAGALSLLFAVFWVFLLEYFDEQRRSNSPEYQAWQAKLAEAKRLLGRT